MSYDRIPLENCVRNGKEILLKIGNLLCTLLPTSSVLFTSSSTIIVVLAIDFGEGFSSESKGCCSKDEVSPIDGGEPGTNVISLDSNGFIVTVKVGISNAGNCKSKHYNWHQ